MTMAKNDRTVEDIDEAALLQSVYEQSNPSAVVPKELEKTKEVIAEHIEKTKEIKEGKEPAKRRRSNADYSSLFLARNEIRTRSCVYVSQRIHNTISEIVRVLADKDVTVGGYIDNVLLQHLETHKEEINELYKRERKNLIEF
jgi:hypothetical protein